MEQNRTMAYVWDSLSDCIEKMKRCEMGETQTVVSAIEQFKTIANEVVALSVANEERIKARVKLYDVVDKY